MPRVENEDCGSFFRVDTLGAFLGPRLAPLSALFPRLVADHGSLDESLSDRSLILAAVVTWWAGG